MSAAFVRRHRAAYVGVSVLLGVATVVTTVEMVLYTGLASGDAIQSQTLDEFDARVVRAAVNASQGILQVMCFTTVAIALVLVYLGFRKMLALRRHELGQMRLAGASVLQVRVMVTTEALVFATTVVVPSVIVGQLLSHPFYLLLQSVGVFGSSLQLDFGVPVGTLAAVAAGMISCSVVAAWLSLRTRQAVDVLAALDSTAKGDATRRVSTVRLLVAALSVVGLTAFLVFMPDTGSENPVASIIVPLLIVFPLGALAPVLVPGVARLLAWTLWPLIRGSGVLVAQRASRDSRRFASNVLPLLILMGVLGGFAIGAGPDQATTRADYDHKVTADLVAQPTGTKEADAVFTLASELKGVNAVMRSAATTRLLESGRPDGTFLTVFNFVDLDTYRNVFDTEVRAGDFAAAGGTKVVSARERDKVGDTITVEAPNGATVTLQVAAVVASRIYSGLLLDWGLMQQLDPQVWDVRAFLSTGTEDVSAVADEVRAVAPVLTKDQYIHTRVELRQSNARTGNIALFGTIYVLAVVAMIQGLAASTLNRRGEYRLLRLLGVSRPRIIGTLLSEAVVLVLTSGALLTVAFAFIAWRYVAGDPGATATAVGAIDWGGIALTFAVMSGLFAATVLVSALFATREADRR
ncbi:FtsX-like permease family protein [Microbacterium sp. SLBN-111]|uniref:ABC transporter permease n=1 Tax=Microbacterium sp. SLBN-111 TaxID=3377733 RepID=UPI003C767416